MIPYFLCLSLHWYFYEEDAIMRKKRAHIFVNIESSVIYVNDPVFSQKGNILPPPKSSPLLQIHRGALGVSAV